MDSPQPPLRQIIDKFKFKLFPTFLNSFFDENQEGKACANAETDKVAATIGTWNLF